MTRRSFRVEWAAAARHDLISILDYLSQREPEAAASALERLEKRAAALEVSPRRGRVVPELLRLQIRDYREIIVSPYRLLYRVKGSRVGVLGVFDARRNLEDILLDRILGLEE